jgi:hypothetical protein
MSFLAETSIVVSATPEAAFDRLADYPTWKEWMPKSFHPTSARKEPLSLGAKVKTRVARMPVPTMLEVVVFERGKELTWRGGNGALNAWHRFLFEAAGDNQTRVRSVETWAGVLSFAVKPIVRKLAEKIGREQLEALQASLSTRH